MSVCVSTCQHVSVRVSACQHVSVRVSACQHVSVRVSTTTTCYYCDSMQKLNNIDLRALTLCTYPIFFRYNHTVKVPVTIQQTPHVVKETTQVDKMKAIIPSTTAKHNQPTTGDWKKNRCVCMYVCMYVYMYVCMYE